MLPSGLHEAFLLLASSHRLLGNLQKIFVLTSKLSRSNYQDGQICSKTKEKPLVVKEVKCSFLEAADKMCPEAFPLHLPQVLQGVSRFLQVAPHETRTSHKWVDISTF